MASTASAQGTGGPVWMRLDDRAPGSPADVVLEAASSTPSDTWLDVTIHGFWVETRVGPDGRIYHKVDVPGLENLGIIGAPHLSIVRRRLALATSADQATLLEVIPLQPSLSFGLHLWPEPIPAQTGQVLVPEQFTLDPAIYGSPGPYPAEQGSGTPRTPIYGSIPSSTIEAHPCVWYPSSDRFDVMPSSRWHFAHAGPAQAFNPITRDRARLCASMVMNWGAVQAVMPINVHDYQGEYLFVYPSTSFNALKPLIAQKKWRGFTVAQIVTDTLGGASCEHVKNAIRAWCRATPSEHDHYALLAGDFGDILMCNTGTDLHQQWTDDPYASLDDDTFGHDVFVGRLAATDAADLSHQVTKILNYEDHPVAAPVYYGDVLLVAHRSGFDAAQDSVRARPYAVAPNFFAYYGVDTTHTNAGLAARINAGFGITCYRGHGGPSEWFQWDRVGSCGGGLGQCFASSDVDALSNGPLTTVVWTIACNNSDLTNANCIGRHWMSKFPGGAVAHYGSTMPSNNAPNDQLELALFDAVWNRGITHHANAIAWAEDQMIAYDGQNGGLNAYLYTLLGDPEMQIRRTVQPPWTVAQPGHVAISPGGTELGIHVSDAAGAPIAGALVSLWKPALGAASPGGAGGDEVAVNGYSADDGSVHLSVAPQSSGFIMLAVRDSAGNSVVDSIAVDPVSGVEGTALGVPRLRAVPSIARGRMRWSFGAPLREPGRVEIFGADGRQVATLRAPAGVRDLEWRAADAAGRALPSGIYFARLRSGGLETRSRVVLLR